MKIDRVFGKRDSPSAFELLDEDDQVLGDDHVLTVDWCCLAADKQRQRCVDVFLTQLYLQNMRSFKTKFILSYGYLCSPNDQSSSHRAIRHNIMTEDELQYDAN